MGAPVTVFKRLDGLNVPSSVRRSMCPNARCGVLDDGHDRSSDPLSVLKALTCIEGQSARALGHVVIKSYINSALPSPWCLRAPRRSCLLSNNSTFAFISCVPHDCPFGVAISRTAPVSTCLYQANGMSTVLWGPVSDRTYYGPVLL